MIIGLFGMYNDLLKEFCYELHHEYRYSDKLTEWRIDRIENTMKERIKNWPILYEKIIKECEWKINGKVCDDYQLKVEKLEDYFLVKSYMLANTTEYKIAQCEEEDDLKHFEDCTETGQGYPQVYQHYSYQSTQPYTIVKTLIIDFPHESTQQSRRYSPPSATLSPKSHSTSSPSHTSSLRKQVDAKIIAGLGMHIVGCYNESTKRFIAKNYKTKMILDHAFLKVKGLENEIMFTRFKCYFKGIEREDIL